MHSTQAYIIYIPAPPYGAAGLSKQSGQNTLTPTAPGVPSCSPCQPPQSLDERQTTLTVSRLEASKAEEHHGSGRGIAPLCHDEMSIADAVAPRWSAPPVA